MSEDGRSRSAAECEGARSAAGDDESTPTAGRPFHVMTKPTGPACNLECDYCYYLETAELYPGRSEFRMSEETLETYVRQYVEAQPGPEVTFAWQGGEPTLLGLEFFRRVLELQERYAPSGIAVRNTLQTNGTLLDDEWCRFLAEHDFLVGISVDGPKRLHDRFRRTRADDPTFEAVYQGLSLLQEHGVETNVLCVVNADNVRHPLEVYRFIRREGVEWIQFIPLVEPLDEERPDSEPPHESTEYESARVGDAPDHRVPEWVAERGGAVEEHDDDYTDVVEAARAAPVSGRSVDPEAFGTFACTIFDEWVRNDVGEISVRLFDSCLESHLYGRSSACVFEETCGAQLAVEHDGTVYACDHFVDPGFRRGNVHDEHLATLVDAPDQRRFGAYKREGLPARCRACPVRASCHGGCPKNWLLRTPAGDPGLNYLCAAYRRFFTYAGPYLDLVEATIEDGLPLPLVMDAVAVHDERRSESTE